MVIALVYALSVIDSMRRMLRRGTEEEIGRSRESEGQGLRVHRSISISSQANIAIKNFGEFSGARERD